jgi:hypothetical protein
MTKVGNKGGRPSKYKEEFVNEVDVYLKECSKEQMKVPTKQEFAMRIGVDDDTLDNWANAVDDDGKKIRPLFFGALKKLMQAQAIQLINDGIYGGKEVNSTIVKLLLQNNHGMKERNDYTTDGDKIAGPIPYIPSKDNE